MNYKYLAGAFLLALLLIPIMEATLLGQGKVYDAEKRTIKIKTNLLNLFPTGDYADYTLLTNTENCVVDCQAMGIAVLYGTGALFDDVKFKSHDGNSKTIQYQFYILESGGKWKKYNYEELPAGRYYWKLEGRKDRMDRIDWIAEINSEKLSEWAWWNGSMNVSVPEPTVYYTFDEGTGTNANDFTIGNHDGTLKGSVAWSTSDYVIGGAVNFTQGRASGNISLGSSSAVSIVGSPATISMWIKPNRDTISHAEELYGASDFPPGFGLQLGTGKQIIWSKLGVDSATSTGAINTTRWTHIAVVLNSTAVTFYINGTLDSSAAYTSTTTAYPTILGWMDSQPETNYTGLMDEFAIWNVALNASSVSNIYNFGKGAQYLQNSTDVSTIENAFDFGLCNASLTTKIVNLTFMDELTLTKLNATIDASTWTYIGTTTTKTFNYVNLTHNPSYAFCVKADPLLTSYRLTQTIQYSGAQDGTFPQRRVYYDETYTQTSSVNNRTLYLLNLNNGITSNIQVINVGNQLISDAYVKTERTVGTSVVKIADGYTDASGSISFFLSPNYDTTITVVKAGYITSTNVIRPSSSGYLITLATSTSPFYFNGTVEGITYVIKPATGIISDGMKNFSFVVNSRTSKIYNCSFYIYSWTNSSVHPLIGSAFGCNASAPNKGGGISTMINISGNISRIKGEYYITLANGTYKIEGDAAWYRITPPNSSSITGGLINALGRAVNLPDWGGRCGDGYTLNETDLYCYANDGSGDKYWNQTADFSRIVFFFIFFAIILGAINYATQYDTAYPGSFVYITTAVVFIGSFVNGWNGPGFFYLPGATNLSIFFDNWLLAFHFLLLSVIYWFTMNKRYQAG